MHANAFSANEVCRVLNENTSKRRRSSSTSSVRMKQSLSLCINPNQPSKYCCVNLGMFIGKSHHSFVVPPYTYNTRRPIQCNSFSLFFSFAFHPNTNPSNCCLSFQAGWLVNSCMSVVTIPTYEFVLLKLPSTELMHSSSS